MFLWAGRDEGAGWQSPSSALHSLRTLCTDTSSSLGLIMLPIPLQRWRLIGLKPMHQAFVRRLATRDALAASIQPATGDVGMATQANAMVLDRRIGCEIEWSMQSKLDSIGPWISRSDADVIIIERGLLLDWLDRNRSDEAELRIPATLARTTPLRLLWSWSEWGARDLAWVTPWLAQGVVHNAATLEAWVRSALRHGTKQPKPPHPLLRDLKLPLL